MKESSRGKKIYQGCVLPSAAFPRQKYRRLVFGTAFAWFLLDIVFYGNGMPCTLTKQGSFLRPN